MDPRVSLRQVTPEIRPVAERLWQLYRHDLSEFRGTLPDEAGTFPLRRLAPFFSDLDRCGYLIYRGTSPSGLALVSGVSEEPRMMAEFFIVRAVRRQQVGHEAVLQLFGMHPGRWEIAFQEANTGAARFWRRVATAVAGDGWSEEPRPVPGKPEIAPDVWITLQAQGVRAR